MAKTFIKPVAAANTAKAIVTVMEIVDRKGEVAMPNVDWMVDVIVYSHLAKAERKIRVCRSEVDRVVARYA